MNGKTIQALIFIVQQVIVGIKKAWPTIKKIWASLKKQGARIKEWNRKRTFKKASRKAKDDKDTTLLEKRFNRK